MIYYRNVGIYFLQIKTFSLDNIPNYIESLEWKKIVIYLSNKHFDDMTTSIKTSCNNISS